MTDQLSGKVERNLYDRLRRIIYPHKFKNYRTVYVRSGRYD